MPKTSTISARIEPKMKSEAEEIFRQLGLTTAQAISLFFAQVRIYHGLPFELRVPNATTRKAIENARKRKGVKAFGSVKSLMDDLAD